MITPADMLALRTIVQKALGLPLEGRACIIIVAENCPDGGSSHQLLGVGLTPDGVFDLLMHSIGRMASSAPDQVGEISPIVSD